MKTACSNLFSLYVEINVQYKKLILKNYYYR
jgi:hypothetical protein